MVRPEIGSHICKTPTTMTGMQKLRTWEMTGTLTNLSCVYTCTIYLYSQHLSSFLAHCSVSAFWWMGEILGFHRAKIQFTPWLVPEVWEGGGSGWKKTMSSGKHWEHFKGCPEVPCGGASLCRCPHAPQPVMLWFQGSQGDLERGEGITGHVLQELPRGGKSFSVCYLGRNNASV